MRWLELDSVDNGNNLMEVRASVSKVKIAARLNYNYNKVARLTANERRGFRKDWQWLLAVFIRSTVESVHTDCESTHPRSKKEELEASTHRGIRCYLTTQLPAFSSVNPLLFDDDDGIYLARKTGFVYMILSPSIDKHSNNKTFKLKKKYERIENPD